MNASESNQCQAALVVSGAWKGTNRDKIYEELGWETLDQRGFFRWLVQFYKIMNNLTPEYLKAFIPSVWEHLFDYRSSNIIRPVLCRTERYRNSFFPDALTPIQCLGLNTRSLCQHFKPNSRSVNYTLSEHVANWSASAKLLPGQC